MKKKEKKMEENQHNIYRYEYRAFLCENREADWDHLVKRTEEYAQDMLKKDLVTAALYRYEHMLFAYYETTKKERKPEEVFLPMTEGLQQLPSEIPGEMRKWIFMYPIYWHSVPESEKEWKRSVMPEHRRGRIAFLKPESLFEYVEHHIKIVQEGLLKGDKRQFISLHENVLFSYFEEPKEFVNIRKEERESEAIKAWMEVNPSEHFIRTPGQKGDFLMLPAAMAMGR